MKHGHSIPLPCLVSDTRMCQSCPVSVSVLHRICSLHEPEENTDTTQAISCKHVHGIEEDCSKEAIRFLVVATCKDPNT